MKRIYLCGPTVYNDLHIGNTRPILSIDFYLRALSLQKKEFYFVQNITDIDDKIIVAAQEKNFTEQELCDFYIKNFFNLLEKLNVILPNELPRVTNNIKNIIDFIEKLITKKAAYQLDGNVYFSVNAISNYGKLANININQQQFDKSKTKNKKHPADFALWKKTNQGLTWTSPWGKGRPGWHTECAYFINDNFSSRSVDIHAGGIDLKFPHHENENAQFYALHKKSIAQNWKHFGHVFTNGAKMAKSLKNGFLAKDFIDLFGANLLRYLFFSTNPFGPIDLNEDLINSKKKEFNRIQNLVKTVNQQLTVSDKKISKVWILKIIKKVEIFDFAQANKLLWDAINLYYKSKDLTAGLKILNTLVGLGFNLNVTKWNEETILIFNKWNQLREDKNYAEADKLREKLKKANMI